MPVEKVQHPLVMSCGDEASGVRSRQLMWKRALKLRESQSLNS